MPPKKISKPLSEESDFPAFSSLDKTAEQATPVKKRRGRKPKGGKIIASNSQGDQNDTYLTSNVVLHLKCRLSDLQSGVDDFTFEATTADVITNCDNFTTVSKPDLNYSLVNTTIVGENAVGSNFSSNDKHFDSDAMVSRKLKELESSFYKNDISDKQSACFWCTCEFDNHPIYIPSHESNGCYHVYGCFCSPECASAYLMEERIDGSTKFERYSLLNHLYSRTFGYKDGVKPAPNPHYTLDKFYGNLSIQEYRQLFRNERLIMVVQKPLTRVLPELHQDNSDYNSTTNNQSTSFAGGKFRLKRKGVQPDKKTLVNSSFGISAS